MKNIGPRKTKFAGKIIVGVLLLTVFAIFAVQQKRNFSSNEHSTTVSEPQKTIPPKSSAMQKRGKKTVKKNDAQKPKTLPRLVDLGADKCIPCKMMAPILEELRAEYKGKLQVEFIDVWKDPDAGEHYGIRLIPTQIFYDGEGREIYRHEGFMSKEDILEQWKKLGVALKKIEKK